MFIQDHGGTINEDLAELWRRIVFNIAVSNTDDHLRNHGFIIENGAWRLSPAYDVNPSIDKEELVLNIDESSGTLDFDLALSVAEYFRLTPNEAQSILSKVLETVKKWEKTAKQVGISRSEIEVMQPAFRF
jgi:serine/threonine-protein kinase HipA